jgi:hypothetical protein
LHLHRTAHRGIAPWLAALVGLLALLFAAAAVSQAAEPNANQYSCLGGTKAGRPEPGSEEQQVSYSFYCNGPITGYQLESQIPLTGIASAPLVTSNQTGKASTDTFSCAGEVPGYALNCVGLAKAGYETIVGQFAIGSKLCVEPREDPLLTVTYAYLEKGVVTQAISGPFDLGRPKGCPPDAYSGGTRLNPKPLIVTKHKHKHEKKKKKATAKKSVRHAGRAAHKAS